MATVHTGVATGVAAVATTGATAVNSGLITGLTGVFSLGKGFRDFILRGMLWLHHHCSANSKCPFVHGMDHAPPRHEQTMQAHTDGTHTIQQQQLCINCHAYHHTDCVLCVVQPTVLQPCPTPLCHSRLVIPEIHAIERNIVLHYGTAQDAWTSTGQRQDPLTTRIWPGSQSSVSVAYLARYCC